MSSDALVHTPELPLPEALRAELATDEPVLRVVPCRLMASPGHPTRIAGVLALTTDRLAIAPGAPGSPPEHTAENRGLLADLMRTAGLALVEAFPGLRKPKERHEHIAGRQQPGIQIPLSLVRRAFPARLPSFIGLEIALPLPDPRPPFPLYLELADPYTADVVAGLVETHRDKARPRPELERPYALYYLLRSLPQPVVRLAGPGFARRGALVLSADGLLIGSLRRELLLAYESVERVQWASASRWRKACLTLSAGEREWVFTPARRMDEEPLLDAGHIIAELSERVLEHDVGPLKTAKIVTYVTAGAGTAAAVILEILQFL